MTCVTPAGTDLSLRAGGLNSGYKTCKITDFYLPIGGSHVTFKYSVTPQPQYPVGEVAYFLTNAAGTLLENDVAIAGDGSVVWTLGDDDPHTLYVGTNRCLPGPPRGCTPVATPFSYALEGACTTVQNVANPCVPNPCAAGCTCVAVGPTGGTASCINCPVPVCPTCPPGEYCSAATGRLCKACSPPCPAGAVCGPTINTCTCPAGACCPPCPAGSTCVAGACHAGPPPPGPSVSNQDLLIAAGGAAALLGVFLVVSRHRPVGAPVGAAPRSGSGFA